MRRKRALAGSAALDTMTVTFREGAGKVLARQPGAYPGGNPLRGERLEPGDLVSAGSTSVLSD